MSYSSQTDLTNEIGEATVRELSDDLNSGSIDSDKVNRAISNADAVIDAHIRSHYSVPLSSTPALIRKLSVDLATFNLYSRRGALFDIPNWIDTRQKDAMKMLASIRDGKIDLGIEPPPAISSAAVAKAEGEDYLFDASTLEEF